MCEYDFNDLQKLLLEGSGDYSLPAFDENLEQEQEFMLTLYENNESEDCEVDLDFLIEDDKNIEEDTLLLNEFLDVNPIQITDEIHKTMTVVDEDITLECPKTISVESNNEINSQLSEFNEDNCTDEEVKLFKNNDYFRKTYLSLRNENKAFKVKNKDLLKKVATQRAAKSHREISLKIDFVYKTLPKTYILHNSYARITKFQKLDQMEKFIENVQKHGYVSNK